MDYRDHPQPLPLPPVPHSPRQLLVPQAQATTEDGTVMPLPVGAMAPRQLFKTLQQVAQEGLNQRLRQAAIDGNLNISISSTMNLSIGRMQDVAISTGPDVSIVEIKPDDDGNMSLTALLEEVMDDHTSTPPCDITGHIMEVEIGKVASTSQPAVCSTLPAAPVRTA